MAAGSITFSLLMNTASFQTDTKRAEKRLKELKKEADAMGRAFGIAIAAGAAAATYALKESIDAMDEASKAAQSLGTTTEVITGLAHAASLADVEFSQLSKALVKLTSDTPETLDAFKAMDVSTKDVSGNLKDLPTLLGEVADKFAGYATGAEKTALATSLFGEKIGPKLIPLLNAGSKGIAEMADEARALGLVIDTETGKAAEDFNDNLTRLGGAAKGFANVAAKELLPLLGTISDEMVRGSKEGGGYGKVFGEAIAVAMQTVIVLGSDVAFIFKGIGRDIGGMAAQLVALSTLDFDTFNFLGDEMKKDAAAARAELDAFQARIMGLGSEIAASSPAVSDQVSAPLVEGAKKSKKAADDAVKAYEKLREEGRRLTESVQTPSEKLTSTQGNVNRLAGAGVIDPETQRRALNEAQAVYDEYVQKQRQMLTDGLLTEEQEVQASYDRRRQMILALTEATEQEKADTVAALTEMRDSEINQIQYQRYADLLSEEERVTKEYMERKRQIEDDDTLNTETRYAYLTTLGENYHKRMQELDEEDQAKRDELARKNIKLASEGFANIAEVTKAFGGEQSKEYQAMFAASKAFAIADITVKQSQAIAKAWGENNYWQAIGLSVGLAAQFAGLLSSANSASFGGTRADGGPVSSGRRYLVGERGPEMFQPNEGGRIIPANAMGATSVSVAVDASGSKVQGDGQNATELGRRIGNAVRAVILDEKRSGGLLASG